MAGGHPLRIRVKLVLVAASVSMTLLTLESQALPDRPGSSRPVQPREPRIVPIADAKLTAAQREQIARFVPPGTRPGNGIRTLLTVPELVDHTMSFHTYITRDASLSPRDRELLMLRTAWLHGSDVIWREQVGSARKAGLSTEDLRRIAEGPDAPGWNPFEANLLRMSDQLFRNSFVNDDVFRTLAARYDTCHLMDAGMTVADTAAMALVYNAFGVQPDDAPPGDRMPSTIPYRVSVPDREAVTLNAARLEPLPGPGANNPRTFNLCPKLNAARNGSEYVNQISMLGKSGRARDRELLILRTGWDSQSEYEWSEHVGRVGRARAIGVPVDRIPRGPDASEWSPFEANLLRFADELYRNAAVSDRLWATLKETYDDRMMIDATVTVANYRNVSMALNMLGVQSNPGEEKLPPVPER